MNKQTINIEKITFLFSEKRVKILLEILYCTSDICGCELVNKIGIPKNLLSYHINFMIREGLIEEKRCGQKKNYQLSSKGRKIVKEIIKIQNLI